MWALWSFCYYISNKIYYLLTWLSLHENHVSMHEAPLSTFVTFLSLTFTTFFTRVRSWFEVFLTFIHFRGIKTQHVELPISSSYFSKNTTWVRMNIYNLKLKIITYEDLSHKWVKWLNLIDPNSSWNSN